VLVVVGAALLAGCGRDAGGAAKARLRVGSTNFTEQLILAELYAQALEANGYLVQRRLSLGTREIVAPALQAGELDLCPEYLATFLAYITKDTSQATGDAAAAYRALEAAARPKGLTPLAYAPAVDTNGYVVTKETAAKYQLARLSDLRPVAGQLVLGGPPECPSRPFCLPGLQEKYGITFKEFKALDAGGPLTVAALDSKQIDVAVLFTTDPIIAAKGYVLLDDDRELELADNILPIVRSEVLTISGRALETLLDAVSAKLTTADLMALNRKVGLEKQDPKPVAAEWLMQKGIVKSPSS